MNIVLLSIFSPSMYPISILDKFNEIENSLQAWCSLLFDFSHFLFVLFTFSFLHVL